MMSMHDDTSYTSESFESVDFGTSSCDACSPVTSSVIDDITQTLHNINQNQQDQFALIYGILFTVIGVILAAYFVRWFGRLIKQT